MKMEYKLIKDCGKGFMLTREPETVSDELIVSFTGAPDDATAIFENSDGNSLYRLLKDETCAIPAAFLKGCVKVTVAVLKGKCSKIHLRGYLHKARAARRRCCGVS